MAVPRYGARTPHYNVPVYGQHRTPTYGGTSGSYNKVPSGFAGRATTRRVKRAGGAQAALSNLRKGIGAKGSNRWAQQNPAQARALLAALRKRVKNTPNYG